MGYTLPKFAGLPKSLGLPKAVKPWMVAAVLLLVVVLIGYKYGIFGASEGFAEGDPLFMADIDTDGNISFKINGAPRDDVTATDGGFQFGSRGADNCYTISEADVATGLSYALLNGKYVLVTDENGVSTLSKLPDSSEGFQQRGGATYDELLSRLEKIPKNIQIDHGIGNRQDTTDKQTLDRYEPDTYLSLEFSIARAEQYMVDNEIPSHSKQTQPQFKLGINTDVDASSAPSGKLSFKIPETNDSMVLVPPGTSLGNNISGDDVGYVTTHREDTDRWIEGTNAGATPHAWKNVVSGQTTNYYRLLPVGKGGVPYMKHYGHTVIEFGNA